MFVELLLRPASLEGQRIFPLDARRLVAKALDGHGVKEAFFGRQVQRLPGKENDGHQPLTPIVFDGGKGFIRIYGIGKEGGDLLTDEMGKIVRAVASATNSATSTELRQGNHLRKNHDWIVTYHIAKLVLSKTGKNSKNPVHANTRRTRCCTFFDAKNELAALVPTITSVIDKGIACFAENIDAENLDPDCLGDGLPRKMFIEVHEGTPEVSQIHPDRPGHALVIRNLKFSMLGDLYGPWSVGHLRSHGCGLLKKVIGDHYRG